jgi:Meiotically up-regulated gene 113
VLEKYVELTRRLGHVPTSGERRLERATNDPSFPSEGVYARFGSKNELIGKALGYCRESSEHADVVPILESGYQPSRAADDQLASWIESGAAYGFVYLLRGHAHEYKIGRTNLVDRRVSELGATSPVEQTLVHEIKTDDPVGVEAYWHARFAEKRMRGEWFRLSAVDVRAFKKWRRIY